GLLEVRLREAGLAISPGAAIGLMIVAAVLIFCALWFLALLFWPIAIVASIAGAWVAFNAGLGALRARRVRTVNDALPDCLDVFARGLRAGQPIAAALTVVSQHARGIAQEEFKRCCEEMKLGVPLIAALNGIAERIGTPE